MNTATPAARGQTTLRMAKLISCVALCTADFHSRIRISRVSGMGHFQTLSIAPGEWLVVGVYRPLSSGISKNSDLGVCFPQERSLAGYSVTVCLRPKAVIRRVRAA
jgi:hypothetical protein